MKEILNTDFTEMATQAKKGLVLKASLYIATMVIVGGTILCIYGIRTPFFLFVFTLLSLLPPFTTGLILEGLRWLGRRHKTMKERKARDPFWFKWIESSFSIWIVIIGFTLIRFLF